MKNASILVGQTLNVLSSQSLQPGIHRVVGNSNGRRSIVFALRHTSTQDIDLSRFGGDGRITPLDLWKTIQRGAVNVNSAKGEVVERQLMAHRKAGEQTTGHG
jgi:hypothetical protein